MEIALALIGFTCFFSMWVVLPRFLMARKNQDVRELSDLEETVSLDDLEDSDLSSNVPDSASLSQPFELADNPIPPS